MPSPGQAARWKIIEALRRANLDYTAQDWRCDDWGEVTIDLRQAPNDAQLNTIIDYLERNFDMPYRLDVVRWPDGFWLRPPGLMPGWKQPEQAADGEAEVERLRQELAKLSRR